MAYILHIFFVFFRLIYYNYLNIYDSFFDNVKPEKLEKVKDWYNGQVCSVCMVETCLRVLFSMFCLPVVLVCVCHTVLILLVSAQIKRL